MIQRLKIALYFMQSSKALYLGLPHTGLAENWKSFHPRHATTDDTLGLGQTGA